MNTSKEEELAFYRGMLHVVSFCSALSADSLDLLSLPVVLLMALQDGARKIEAPYIIHGMNEAMHYEPPK